MQTVLLINIFNSVFLCGLIWTVQIVHYPSFHKMDISDFSEAMQFHKLRISILVIPFMLFELDSSILLAIEEDIFSTIHQTGLAIVIAIWLITFFVQAPLHEKLSSGYNRSLVNRLVKANWCRTILWTIKIVLGAYLFKSKWIL